MLFRVLSEKTCAPFKQVDSLGVLDKIELGVVVKVGRATDQDLARLSVLEQAEHGLVAFLENAAVRVFVL